MHRPVRRGARAVVRARRAPWRERGTALALAALAALWVAGRAGAIAPSAALALGLLVVVLWALATRASGAA